MDRLIHRPRIGQMGQWTDRAMDGQTNVWTKGQIDGPMDRQWINGQQTAVQTNG